MHYKTRNELRCGCSRKPLLAYYGIDTFGAGYVHVKATKQRQILQEVVIEKRGIAKIHCRECLRWTRITLVSGSHQVETELDVPAPQVLGA